MVNGVSVNTTGRVNWHVVVVFEQNQLLLTVEKWKAGCGTDLVVAILAKNSALDYGATRELTGNGKLKLTVKKQHLLMTYSFIIKKVRESLTLSKIVHNLLNRRMIIIE